jgi:peptidoglycan/LPS O-acetylase OafA/YrhL
LASIPFSQNRITCVRLVCSILVLASHLDWVAGNTTDYFRRLGLYAVAIFFGLSGFLLTESIQRTGATANFIRNRLLRIFPGFIGVLLLTSFLFAPFMKTFKTGDLAYELEKENFTYLFLNFTTYILQTDIDESLRGSNVQIWNPPLWTLSYELICYFLLFALMVVFGRRYTSLMNVFLPSLILMFFLTQATNFNALSQIDLLVYYCSFFFLGSFLYLKEVHEKIGIIYVLLPLLVLTFLIPRQANQDFFDIRDFVQGLVLIPILLILAFHPKVKIRIINDYSFGMYIYAFPVSQLLVSANPVIGQNWILFASSALGVTFFFAWISWHLIEKPALKFKKSSTYFK